MTKRTKLSFLILGGALLIVLPAITVGQMQFGKGGTKGGGTKGGGMFGQDPGAMFNIISKGKDTIVISELRFGKDDMMRFAQERGITNGQLTRQQYIEYAEARSKAMAGGQPMTPGGGKGFGQPPGDGSFGGKKFGGGPGGSSRSEAMADPALRDKMIEEEFKQRDKNGDNKLIAEEMPGKLRENLTRWDRNGDGFIDLAEFRDYRIAGMEESANGKAGSIASIIIEENELDLKPTVFRAGKLPKNLPPWFKELDADNDGQVALYEWRTGKKNLEEFKLWDVNDDGFITPEECLRQQEVIAKSGMSPSGVASADRGGERPMMFGPGRRPPGSGGPFPSPGDGGENPYAKSKKGNNNKGKGNGGGN